MHYDDPLFNEHHHRHPHPQRRMIVVIIVILHNNRISSLPLQRTIHTLLSPSPLSMYHRHHHPKRTIIRYRLPPPENPAMHCDIRCHMMVHTMHYRGKHPTEQRSHYPHPLDLQVLLCGCVAEVPAAAAGQAPDVLRHHPTGSQPEGPLHQDGPRA